MKKISLKEWCAKVNKSNGAHKRLRDKARSKHGRNCKEARYHQNVINIQNSRCDILSKTERKSIFKRS